MVNRINLLLKAKNITARQFAEEIGIQPSGMSHILSGRNNPSLDFVMKVIRRYPEIDINWLMFGKGEMYEVRNTPRVESIQSAQADLPLVETDSQASMKKRPDSTSSPSGEPIGGLFSQVEENPINDVRSASEYTRRTVQGVNNDNTSATDADNRVLRQNLKNRDSVGVSERQGLQDGSYDSKDFEKGAMPGKSNNFGMRQQADTYSVGNKEDSKPMQMSERKLVRLLAFFDDHTFVEYRPQD